MARTLGTYILSSNIEIEAGAPLDARTIVPLKADLTRAGSFPYPYVGMEVFVTEELQKYRLIGTNPELTDNWTKTDKGVVDGYYDAEHGGFYKDQGFTKPITGTSEVLYIDKSTDNVYRWNGSAFAQINPIDSQVPTIDMADERENIAQDDDIATVMGKVAKYFDDLGDVAFSDDYGDLSNTPTKLSQFDNDAGFVTGDGFVTSVKVGNTAYNPTDGVVSLPQYPDISGKADKATTLDGYGITDAKIANGTITLGGNTITPVTDISGKADKATTLAGYGITDAKIANGTITLGSNTITPLTQHQDISGKADKATTLAGYGITDAKISSGTITLGSNTITPLTQHQDISGKADKATTLAGYGITDAKIASGTITLGSNTITPLTQHQSVTNKGATLAWSSAVTVATIGGTDIKVSLPANPNTNTTYTFTGGTNKFTVKPSNGDAQDITITPSITNNVTGSGTSGYLAKFNGTNTITSGPQLGSSTTTYLRNDGSWATPPDNNTTYTLETGDSNGQIKVKPSSGSAYNVSVKGLGSNAYSSTAYLPLAGGTMTGQIVLSSSGLATSSEAGYTLNSYGNFVHQRTEASDNLNWSNNAGTTLMRYYFETGKLYLQNDKEVLHTGNMYESYLLWGGKNFVSSYGPIDAALMDELGANRFQFIKASAITVEYSRDGGSTWTDYGASDAAKMQIFAQGGSLGIGKNDSSNKATTNPGKYMLRITIDTGTAGIYTVLNKVVVYCSTNGSSNCYCKIQKALQSTPTTFVDHTDNISIGGWSGYNVINISGLTTYGNTASSQYGRVRFIFGDGSGGNTNYNGLQIFQIKGFGGVGWNTPSTMAKTGHLYSYDQDQNATFPAVITATKFNGSSTSVLDKSYGTAAYLNFGGSALAWGDIDYIASWNSGGNEVRATNKNQFVRATTTSNIGIDAPGHCAIAYVSGLTASGWNYQQTDGALYTQYRNSSWIHEIFADYRTGQISLRGKNNGTWQTWRMVLDGSNYTNYTVKKDGTGASGTWGISITGNAATATSATTATKLGSSNVGSATQPIYLSAGTATACTYTLGKSVPSDAVFTDTNNAVTQTATTVNTYTHYEVLLSGTNDNTTRTEQARKTNRLTFDPYMAMLTIGEPKSSSGNGMSGHIYLHEFGSTAKWSISPTAGGEDGEIYSITLPLEEGTLVTDTYLSSNYFNVNGFIKLRIIEVPATTSKNADLSNYVRNNIESGYSFLCWQIMGISNGWVTTFPIYISNPTSQNGNPWWSGSSLGGAVRFAYFEIKTSL